MQYFYTHTHTHTHTHTYIYIYIYIYIWVCVPGYSILLLSFGAFWVFHTSLSRWFLTGVLSECKFTQICRTLLRILSDLDNAVVGIVSARLLISKSSSSCINPSVTVLRAPIITGFTVTFLFYSFVSSLAKLRYLSVFSFSFNFNLWSDGTTKSTTLQDLFSCWLFYT